MDRDATLSTRRSTFKSLCLVPYWMLWLAFLVAFLVELGLIDYILQCATHETPMFAFHTPAPTYVVANAFGAAAATSFSPSSGAHVPVQSVIQMQANQSTPVSSHSELTATATSSARTPSANQPLGEPASASASGSGSSSSSATHSLISNVANRLHMSEPVFIAFLCLSALVLVGFVPVVLICVRVLVGLFVPTHRRIERLLVRLSKLEAFQNASAGGHHHSPALGGRAAGLSKALKLNISGANEPDAFSEAAHRLLFVETMQNEIRHLIHFVELIDSFRSETTRLVLIVDGLDAIETNRLIAALDLINALFSESDEHDTPFIILLAVDPQMIIKGVEDAIQHRFKPKPIVHQHPLFAHLSNDPNLTLGSSGNDSHSHAPIVSITGYDYLRNIVQLPVYLQAPNALLVKHLLDHQSKRAIASAARDRSVSQRQPRSRNVSRQDSISIAPAPAAAGSKASPHSPRGRSDSKRKSAAHPAGSSRERELDSDQVPLVETAGGSHAVRYHKNSDSSLSVTVEAINVGSAGGQKQPPPTHTNRKPLAYPAEPSDSASLAAVPYYASQNSFATQLERRSSRAQSIVPGGGGAVLSGMATPAGPGRDLVAALSRNDYFSDINPKSMRRLMNITAVIGRFLRAYGLDVDWAKLATWVNITEQWPYRAACIVWYFEEHFRELDDSQPLRTIYSKCVPFFVYCTVQNATHHFGLPFIHIIVLLFNYLVVYCYCTLYSVQYSLC